MTHTVFVNDKALRFVDIYEADQWKGNTGSIFISEGDLSVEQALLELEQTPQHPGFIYMTAGPDVSWQLFISYCTLSEAAGGLVMNEKGEYLLIFRHGRWDLPKGKLDYDETPQAAALREVQEECGIEHREIVKPLETTFHTYFLDGKRMLKKTHWFLMQMTGETTLTPQLEEDIQQAVWFSKEEIRGKVFANTYASINELLATALNLKHDSR